MPEVKCPNGHKLNVPDAYLGQEVRCSVCNATFVAPVDDSAAQQVAAQQIPVSESPLQPTTPATAAMKAEQADIAVSQESVSARQRSRGARGFLGFLDTEKFGKPALFAGLILVIFSRGCDGLGARWVNRLRAKAESEPRKFEQRTKRLERGKKGDEVAAIRKKSNEQRDDLQDKWADLSDSASNAGSNHAQWAFFYHCGFLLGSLTLSVGLLIVGFNGTGSERTICLIMIAIITFSIYIAGLPWVEGAAASMMAR